MTLYLRANDAAWKSRAVASGDLSAPDRLSRVGLLHAPYDWVRDQLALGRFLARSTSRYDAAQVEAALGDKVTRYLGHLGRIRDAARERGIELVVANQQCQSLNLDAEEIVGVSYEQEQSQVRARRCAAPAGRPVR